MVMSYDCMKLIYFENVSNVFGMALYDDAQPRRR